VRLARGDERVAKAADAAELVAERREQRVLRPSTAAGLHRAPVEIVVPDLRGVVEERALRGAHQALEIRVRPGRVRDERIQLLHVAGVVLAVVQRERLAREMRSEGVAWIGQGLELERHEGRLLHPARATRIPAPSASAAQRASAGAADPAPL
jgi:hypothetical protein